MLDAVYTSPPTCDVVARRAIRERGKSANAPVDTLTHHYTPLISALRQKGKLPRGFMAPHVRKLHDNLAKEPGIINLRLVKTQQSKLSANERYDLCFYQAIPSEEPNNEERWLTFTGWRITATRHHVTIFRRPGTFKVSDHLLSRYMQRKKQPLETFFNDILRPMALSIPLSKALVGRDNRQVALPFASGLLLGNVEYYRRAKVMDTTHAPTMFRCGPDGIDDLSEQTHEVVMPELVCAFIMRTFIDRENMSPIKTDLDLKLAAFEAQYHESAHKLHEMTQTLLPLEGFSQDDAEAQQMFVDADALVASSEWNRCFPA